MNSSFSLSLIFVILIFILDGLNSQYRGSRFLSFNHGSSSFSDPCHCFNISAIFNFILLIFKSLYNIRRRSRVACIFLFLRLSFPPLKYYNLSSRTFIRIARMNSGINEKARDKQSMNISERSTISKIAENAETLLDLVPERQSIIAQLNFNVPNLMQSVPTMILLRHKVIPLNATDEKDFTLSLYPYR